MRLSIAFSGFTGLESTMPAVLAADEAGLDGVWSASSRSSCSAIPRSIRRSSGSSPPRVRDDAGGGNGARHLFPETHGPSRRKGLGDLFGFVVLQEFQRNYAVELRYSF
ncbi:MAG: hypothetical protein ACREQQ_10445 [Candidatus Binatia bacterium]